MRDRRTQTVKQYESILHQLQQYQHEPNDLAAIQSELLIKHIAFAEQHLTTIEDALVADPLNSPLKHTWIQATYALQKLYERLQDLNKTSTTISTVVMRVIQPSQTDTGDNQDSLTDP